MHREPENRSTRVGSLLLLALLLVACAGPPPVVNAPPTLEAIADRTVARNTLTPPSLTIDLIVADPDSDTLTVTVDSDTPAAIPDSARTCVPGTCSLTLIPSVDASAEVAITVTVDDGDGGTASDAFTVSIVPARVVTFATDSGDGSLRQAIADADPGDVIGFDGAVFAIPRLLALATPLTIAKDLTIEGPGRDQLTLSGGGVSRVLIVEASAIATVSGVTIADGVSSTAPLVRGAAGSVAAFTDDSAGGGVVVDIASALTLLDSRVIDSAAVFGGGIYNLGTLTVRRSAIVGNFAEFSGGGIYTAEGASTTVAESDLSGNRADGTVNEDEGGGALLNDHGTLVVTEGSRLFDNEAISDGGAILNIGGDLTIEGGVEIYGNRADEGGGIYQQGDGATALLTGSTVGGPDPEDANVADRGGGIYQLDDPATFVIDGATIRGNTASGSGGGIYQEGTVPMIVRDSVIAGNSATNGGGGILHVDGLTIEGTTIGGSDGSDANTAARGGGIYSNFDTLVLGQGSAVLGNSATEEGGGIYARSSTLILSDSIIAANDAAGDGGGIFMVDSDPGDVFLAVTTLTGMTIGDPDLVDGSDEGNGAMFGGGVYVASGTLELDDASRIRGNAASVVPGGGGVFNEAGVLVGVDCDGVSDNTPDDVVDGPTVVCPP